MSLINNTEVYPIKENPQSTDFVVGTDSNDEGKTVSFLVGDFQASVGATIYSNSNTIPEDRVVTHVSELKFTGSTVDSEYVVDHINGHEFKVNQDGIFGTTLGIGTSINVASAALQIDSTTKGFLPPRMTEAQRDLIISPATGLTIFNTDSGFLEYYDGSSWVTNSNTNIYNSNGTLSGARNVSGENGDTLTLSFYNTNSSSYTNKSDFIIGPTSTLIQAVVGDGLGGVSSTSSFEITQSDSGVFTDTTNSKGISYAADYSANYTDRSLVDKGYVDSVAGTTTIYTGDGELSGSRVIRGLNSDSLIIQTFDLTASNFTTSGLISSTDTVIKIASQIGTGSGTLDTERSIILGPSGMLVGDSTDNKGLVYADDYSANFTARSLVDKDYVDQLSGSTFYESNGVIDATARTVVGTNNTSLDYKVNDLLSGNFTSRTSLVYQSGSMVQTLDQGNGAGAVTGQIGFNATLSAFTIIDSINDKGMVYAADYSANYTNRSIVDKSYVDSQVGMVFETTSQSSAYVASPKDCVLADASSAGFIVTLPPAASNTDMLICIKKVDATVNVVTIDGDASETIDGSLTVDINTQYDSITVISNGIEWFII